MARDFALRALNAANQSRQKRGWVAGGKKQQDIFVCLEQPRCKVSLSGQLGERLHVRLDDGAGDRRRRKMEM